MGEEKIVVSFIANSSIEFKIGDYVIHQGQEYHIREEANVEEINSFTYKYDLTFYSSIYKLYDEIMLHLNRTSFSYTGTPYELLSLLVDSIEEEGWSIGSTANITEPITFQFEDVSCRVALTDIAQQFGLEYKVVGKQINLVQRVGTDRDISFSYGKQNGAYKLLRQKVDQGWATVWRGYGGNQNIPASYRDGSDRLTLPAPYEVNTSLYGRKKGTVKFDYIYPRRTGTITAITDLVTVEDNTIDFDLNQQVISDGTAKIVFKSGELSGMEFTIQKFDYATKTIVFATNKDETGYVTPNTTFSPAVGDKYTFVGIVMPQSYIDAAEAELSAALVEYANKNSRPPFAILPDIDEKYIREKNLRYIIQAGDRVNVTGLRYSGALRVQSISYPLCNPDKITLSLSDTVIYSTAEQIAKDTKQTKRLAESTKYRSLFAKQLAQEVASAVILNQFKKTYVGDYVVMSGAFLVGNPDDGVVGGMDGSGDEESLIFFAGSSYEDREDAPLRIYRNGDVYLLNAFLKGEIEATSGKFGVLEILGNSIVNNFESLAQLVLRNDPESQMAAIGTNVKPATAVDKASAIYQQGATNPDGWNIGAEFRASGSSIRNLAIWAPEGESLMNLATINGRSKIEATLNSQNLQVDCSKYDLICINPTGSGDSGVTLLTDNIYAGKQVTIINLNMGKAMFVYNSIRGYTSVEINAGGSIICTYTGEYWYESGKNF